MESLKKAKGSYIEELKRRSKKSRVTKPYQFIGLEIATMLGDKKHKSLYIKLAKELNPIYLLELAHSVSGRKNIKNMGAYFMKILYKKEK